MPTTSSISLVCTFSFSLVGFASAGEQPKWFFFHGDKASPAGTNQFLALGMPFSVSAFRSALPGFKISEEVLEGETTISATYPYDDKTGVIAYGKSGSVNNIESFGEAGDANGVRVGMKITDVPFAFAQRCSMDELSGNYFCKTKAPFSYRVDAEECLMASPRPSELHELAGCLKVTTISVSRGQ